jgi:hypothetical protein
MNRKAARDRVNKSVDALIQRNIGEQLRTPKAVIVVDGANPSLGAAIADALSAEIADAGEDVDLVELSRRVLFVTPHCAQPEVIEAQRLINASMRACLDVFSDAFPPRAQYVPHIPDHFGDEGLTLAQKVHREQALNHGR